VLRHAVVLSVLALSSLTFLVGVMMRTRESRPTLPVRRKRLTDPVDLGSDLSFPASDPPSWTGSSSS
jgi:hypothetical protein